MISSIYKICRTSWGIYIELSGSYKGLSKSEGLYKVTEKLYLELSNKAYPESMGFNSNELGYLLQGLRFVSQQIEEHSEFDKTVVVIDSILVNHCDYQEEEIIPAVIGWAGKAFGFQTDEIAYEYNKEKI